MLYRLVRFMNEWYALSVLWAYLALFLLAFALIFVFPLGPILLLFLGLAGMGVVVVTGRLLRGTQHKLARHALAHGRCPRCESAASSQIGLNQSWTCPQCGTRFGAHGDESTDVQDPKQKA